MRHRKVGRKLGRTSSHRSAMMRNMVTSLLQHERIETTDAKAKELRKLADRMITLAKRGDLHARRQALSVIKSKAVTHKLFTDIRERFLDRNGGYTRILKKGYRRGDCAPVSIIELIPADFEKAKKAKKEVPKTKETVKKEKKQKAPTAAPVEQKAQQEPETAEAPDNEVTEAIVEETGVEQEPSASAEVEESAEKAETVEEGESERKPESEKV